MSDGALRRSAANESGSIRRALFAALLFKVLSELLTNGTVLPTPSLVPCRYERARTVPINTTLYHVNCHAVLTDDPCFRIAYNTATSNLTITLVEPDKAPEALGNAMEGYVTDYIK